MLFLGKNLSENAIVVALLKQFVCCLGEGFKLLLLVSIGELEVLLEEFET
jgi:hypothetical protein